MDKASFFGFVRKNLFGGALKQSQVDGLEKIIDYWQSTYPQVTVEQMAYILATVHHETGRTMQPIREAGGEAYLRRKRYYPWVGEGLVQVTWEENAKKFGAQKPGDLLTWPIALYACFQGMTHGMFTGKKLSDYINSVTIDYIGARKIINGTDKAGVIAAYAELYWTALNKLLGKI